MDKKNIDTNASEDNHFRERIATNLNEKQQQATTKTPAYDLEVVLKK